jgi:hypothetical protein
MRDDVQEAKMRIAVLALATTVAFASAAGAQNTQSGSDAAGKKGTVTESQSGKAMSRSSGTNTQIGVEQRSGDSARTSTRTRSSVSVRGESGPDVIVHKRQRQHITVHEDSSPSVTVVKKKKKYATRKRTHVVATGPESSTTVVRSRRSTSRYVVDGGRTSTSVKVRTKTGTDSAATKRSSTTRSTAGSGSSATTGSSTNAPAATGSTSQGSGTSKGKPAQQEKAQ